MMGEDVGCPHLPFSILGVDKKSVGKELFYG